MKKLIDLLKKKFAWTGDVNIGGNNTGTVNQINCIAEQGGTINYIHTTSESAKQYIQQQTPSNVTAEEPAEKHIHNSIDRIARLIKKRKTIVALEQFKSLYEEVAAASTGRIRFRIKANMGLCCYLNGEEVKAAELLEEAYHQAPSEPKAITNRVFSMILRGDQQAAFEFGLEKLKENPNNEELAGYVIQAARGIKAAEDPVSLIPTSIADSAPVLNGLICYLHGDKKWKYVARKGYKLHPNDENLEYYSTIADLDDVITNYTELKSPLVIEKHYSRIVIISETLKKIWRARCAGEAKLKEEDCSIGYNYILCLGLANNEVSLLEEYSSCKADGRSSDSLYTAFVISFLHIGNIKNAESAIRRIEPKVNVRIYQYLIFAELEDYEAIASFSPDWIKTFPPNEVACAEAVQFIAKERMSKSKYCASAFGKILQVVGYDSRALIILANYVQSEENQYIADGLYDEAFQLMTESMAERVMVADYASKIDDWQGVIDCLGGKVSKSHDSRGLWLLARAHAYRTPHTTESLRFFEDINQKIRRLHRFQLLEGILNFNCGNQTQAVVLFKAALNNVPNDARSLLLLVRTYLSRSDHDAITQCLEGVAGVELVGTPQDLIGVAQILVKYSFVQRGLDLAYEIVCSSDSSPDIILCYIGIFFFLLPPSCDLEKNVVADDCYVKLTSDHGTEFSFIINDSARNPSSDSLPLTHELVALSMGLTVGATFEVGRGLSQKAWTVKEIKSKYVHKRDVLISTFNAKFPNNNGLIPLDATSESFVDKLTSHATSIKEQRLKLSSTYLSKRIPLQILSSQSNSSVFSISKDIVASDSRIITGTGDHLELNAESYRISESSFDSVSLDEYTTWHVACCNLFVELNAYFGSIYVPSSVFDSLNTYASDLIIHSHALIQPYYVEGERLAHINEFVLSSDFPGFIQHICGRINDNAIISTALYDKSPEDSVAMALKLAGGSFFDPLIVGNDNTLLISEDWHFRDFARIPFGNRHSTWLYPVLMAMHNDGYISTGKYLSSLIYLSRCSHSYLSLTSDILLAVLYSDRTQPLDHFSAITTFIGGKDAEWHSHALVSLEFFRSLWTRNKMSSDRLSFATSIYLKSFFRSCPDWELFYLLFSKSVTRKFSDYIKWWRLANLLPEPDIAAVEKRLKRSLS